MDVAIVVHGGAGTWPEDAHGRARDGVQRAVAAGHAVLAAGGDALAAVQAAVIVLEDDPVFNAGRGAALDERGRDRATTPRSCAAPTAPRAPSPRSPASATRCAPPARCSTRAGT